MFTPPDAEPFGREFDPSVVREALSALLDSSSNGTFAAVAFTGQREGLAFLDDHREPLLISPNVDARASAEGIEIDAARATDVYAATGHLPSLMQAPAKFEWLRRNRPDDAARVAGVIPLADWLASMLTRTLVVSRTLAVENGLVDIRTGEIAAALPTSHCLNPAFVPSIVEEGFVIAAAAATGLASTPVVLAGADTQCALTGMGALSPRDVAVPAGWSAPVQLVTDMPLFDPEMRSWTGVHVVPHRCVLESNAGDTGRAWQWAAELCDLSPHEAQCIAAQSAPGARDVMTVLGPRTMNAAAMTAGVGGVTLPLPLAISPAGRPDVLRSVLESTAYAIRANVEQLEEVSGVRIATLRLGGGMSQSATFAQILADVLDRPIAVAATPNTTAIGAAMLGFVALGVHPTLEAAVGAMSHATTVEPDPRRATDYDDFYARWCTMADAFARMAAEA